MRLNQCRVYILLSLLLCAADAQPAVAFSLHGSTYKLALADCRCTVVFTPDGKHVRHQLILDWLQTAARAIVAYYGQFPCRRLLIRIKIKPGGNMGFSTAGFEHGRSLIEIPIGIDIAEDALKSSWVATHEMSHLAFPMVPGPLRWVAEGQATYIEPIARLQIGDRTAQQVWGDLAAHLPAALPKANEGGLTGSRRLARIYWGGALYCLLADMQIRQQTANARGFQDAARAILAAGGNCASDWPVTKALEVGDQAVGGHVLVQLFQRLGETPVQVDLKAMWSKLGVQDSKGCVEFDDKAPLSAVRKAIEQPVDR